MEIRILGPLEAADSGRAVRLGGPRQRAVLANLVVRANQVVPAEQLIEEIWGEAAPPAARSSLQSYVSRLRSALGEGRIEWRPPGYRFRAEPDEIDALRFETAVRDARARLAGEPERAADNLAAALALWQGRPLPELAERGALQAEVARLEELRADAAEEWLRLELSLGRHDRAIAGAEQLLVDYPLRERLWGLLMLGLYRAGRQAEALDAYQRVRTTLAEELGLDPSPELDRLQVQILRHDPELEQRGLQLRGYRLLEPIGEGMFGIVHRAIQPGVGREVALKAIRPRLAHDPDFIRRFEAEAQLVARLEHPRIVPLYDYWRDEYGAFLVMRWLRGGSLRGALRTGPLEPRRGLAILAQVGEALAAAHSAGVIHRDLKPANVLLDGDGNAYLSDFGIAKELAAAQADEGGSDSSGYLSPEELRGAPATARTDVYGLGIVAYELLAGRSPWTDGQRDHPTPLATARPGLPAAVDGVIARALAPAAEERYQRVDELVRDLQTAFGPAVAAPRAPAVARNPYKGLHAFAVADAHDFFGRKALVDQLVRRLAEPGPDARLLAVVGPSGSGKSSVVRAGLLPALRNGALPGSERWYVAEMLPGHAPLGELERALRRVAARPTPAIGSMLANAEDGLAAAVDAILPDDGAELVILVDQLEEVFTQARSADRAIFLERLTSAVRSPGSRLRVVLTLRADFYDRPLAQRAFGELVGARTQVVPAMSPAEIEEVIRGPIEAVGGRAEPTLVASLVGETMDQPGALPLLEHTLTELFERRRDGELTVAGLEAVGGVSGAVARRAEQIYGRLDPPAREAARQLFMRLVTVGADGSVTRRRALRGELAATDGARGTPAVIETVLEAFGRYRFLTFDHDATTRSPTVEVAHEALLGAWHRLRSWLAEARDEIRLRERLIAMAEEWQRSGGDASFLARGSQLDAFATSLAGTTLAATPLEREFLLASQSARVADEAAAAEQLERERTLERRSMRRLQSLAATLAAGAALAIGLAAFGFTQVQAAEREARTTAARGLASAALANLNVDPDLSIDLAIESVELTRAADGTVLREAFEALHRAVLSSREIARLEAGERAVSDHDLAWYTRPTAGGTAIRDPWSDDELVVIPVVGVQALAVSVDRALVAVADDSGAISIWRVDGPTRIRDIRAGSSMIDDLAFSPDGRRVAAKWLTGAAIWELESGRELDIPFSDPEPHGIRLDWSPDGTLLAIAVGAADADTMVVSGVDGKPVRTLMGYGRTATFSPDGSLLLTTGQSDGALWDTSTWSLVEVLPHQGWVDGADFSVDGSLVATGGDDGFARVWDVGTGDQLLAIPGPSGRVGLVEFDPAAKRLAGWSASGGMVWDITPAANQTVTSFDNPRGALSFNVAVGPAGRLLTGGETGATIWTAAGQPLAVLDTGDVPVADVAINAAGDLVATGGFDGLVRLWTVDGEQVDTLVGHGGQVWGVAFSPDGTRLASVATDGTGRVWDVASRRQLELFTGHPAAAYDVAWSPDGSLLVSVGDDAAVWEWDPSSGEPIRQLVGHRENVIEQAFSPDGSRVATASFDGTAIVWDVANGSPVFTLSGHGGVVADVEASPDGTRWATASQDGTVRIWDAGTGEELLTLDAQMGAGRLAFLDDEHLAVANGEVRIFTLDVVELLAIARERAMRPLTESECQQYLHRGCSPGGS